MLAVLLQKLADHVVQQLDVVKVIERAQLLQNKFGQKWKFTHILTGFITEHIDTSAYVEYSSSSDENEKPQNRSKPAKRRNKDDSDSGSDVSTECFLFKLSEKKELGHTNIENDWFVFIYFLSNLNTPYF